MKPSSEKMQAIMRDHIAKMEEQMEDDKQHPEKVVAREKPYWDSVLPTYIENWPNGLLSLSIATIDIPLTVDDCDRLTSNNGEFGEGLEKEDISDIIEKIDNVLKQYPNGGFIRLGSRSPKDSFIGYRNKFKCLSGQDAINILCDTSERVHEDLRLAKIMNYSPHIFIREYIDIPGWAEFRCFIQEKRLIGISQYNYFDKRQEEIVQNADSIEWAIKQAYETLIKPELHLDSVVVDVFITKKTNNNETIWGVKLLEINPFSGMTDPCMFKWVYDSRDIMTIDQPGKFLYHTEPKKK